MSNGEEGAEMLNDGVENEEEREEDAAALFTAVRRAQSRGTNWRLPVHTGLYECCCGGRADDDFRLAQRRPKATAAPSAELGIRHTFFFPSTHTHAHTQKQNNLFKHNHQLLGILDQFVTAN